MFYCAEKAPLKLHVAVAAIWIFSTTAVFGVAYANSVVDLSGKKRPSNGFTMGALEPATNQKDASASKPAKPVIEKSTRGK
jgi:hypothetical protein